MDCEFDSSDTFVHAVLTIIFHPSSHELHRERMAANLSIETTAMCRLGRSFIPYEDRAAPNALGARPRPQACLWEDSPGFVTKARK